MFLFHIFSWLLLYIWKLSILQQVNWKVFLTFYYGIKRNLIKIFNLEIFFVNPVAGFPLYYPIVLRMSWRCNSFSDFSWCTLVYLGSSCREVVLMAADDKLEFYLRILQKETCQGFSQAIRHEASLSFPGTPSQRNPDSPNPFACMPHGDTTRLIQLVWGFCHLYT